MIGTRKKWALSLLTSSAFLLLVTVLLVLNPRFLYANQTVTAHYTIYHNRSLDPALLPRLAQARAINQQSSLFDSALRLNICLNDGSLYPTLIEKLRGPAFAWGFYRNVVLSGEANPSANYLSLNGYKWNLVQLLAHEATHCYQVHRLGFWHSNPVAGYPTWKWEGYAEYVARRGTNYPPLRQQVRRLNQAEQTTPHAWAITLSDSTSSSREYANYLMLTTYCLDVKRMTYQQLLADTTSDQTVHHQLINWYQQGKSKNL